jgi:hypothetical protein
MFILVENDLETENTAVKFVSDTNDDCADFNLTLIKLVDVFDQMKNENSNLSCIQISKNRFEIYKYGNVYGKTKCIIFEILKYEYDDVTEE